MRYPRSTSALHTKHSVRSETFTQHGYGGMIDVDPSGALDSGGRAGAGSGGLPREGL